jgi:hypothetical protein
MFIQRQGKFNNEAALINRLNGSDAELLEVLATILYLTDMGYTEEEAFKKAKFLKPEKKKFYAKAETMYGELKEKYRFN